MNRKYPNKEIAEKELQIAGELNPGPWVEHSRNTGLACRYIAEKCLNLDAEKAYVLGILHDIGRRVGVVSTSKHVVEGYKYAMEQGWQDAARVCMTHSFIRKDFKVNSKNTTEEELKETFFIREYLNEIAYDDYDKLVQLCDSLAIAEGFCLLEKRFVDVARRYGVGEHTVDKWNAIFGIKDYFEEKMGCSVYEVLPNVKETTFMDVPLWGRQNIISKRSWV